MKKSPASAEGLRTRMSDHASPTGHASSAACSRPGSCTSATTSARSSSTSSCRTTAMLLLHRRLPRPDHAEGSRGEGSRGRGEEQGDHARPARQILADNVRDVALDYLALGLDPREGDVLPPVRRARGARTRLDSLDRHAAWACSNAPTRTRTRSRRASRPASGCSPTRCSWPRTSSSPVAPRAGRQGPGAAPGDDARHRRVVQPRLRRGVPAAGSGVQRGRRGARHRRPEDEQELRQHHRDLRRGQGTRRTR